MSVVERLTSLMPPVDLSSAVMIEALPRVVRGLPIVVNL